LSLWMLMMLLVVVVLMLLATLGAAKAVEASSH
jgi:hypothetical protein